MTNVKPSVLSKSLPRATAAPISSNAVVVHRDLSTDDDDGEAKQKTVDKKVAGVVRPIGQGSGQGLRQQSVGIPKVHPLLAQLGFDSSEITALLRDELIAARSGGRHEGDLADWKHQYRTINATTGTTAEAPYSLAAIAGGTTVSTRTGATIALRKLRIHFRHERTLNGTPTNVTRAPSLFVVVFRDKIPTTPGSVPVIHGTDSLPPSSGTLMLSQLGQNTVDAVSLMVRNPITEDAYHVYAIHRLHLPTAAGYGNFSAGTLGQCAPQVQVHHWDIDLGGVQQKYSSYAATDPDINNIAMVVFSDQAYTGMGFTETFAFVSDVEFHDVQDAL